jgi:hypothetical protein
MSHSVVLVLTQHGTKEEVEQLLAPFDENLKIPSYETKCSCIGRVAKNEVREKTDEKFGTIDDLRKKFHTEVVPLIENPDRHNNHAVETHEKKIDAAWRKFIKPRFNFEDKLFNNHPMKNKPDPDCHYEDGSGCNGTGQVMSTYNPDFKWDWYAIGGRWNGYLNDYDPEQDPDNFETCICCGGSGNRSDMVEVVVDPKTGQENRKFKDAWAKQCNGCNGCHGTGKTLKYSSQWPQQDSNVMPVAEVLKKIKSKGGQKYIPFAILSPNGVWHERGEMGWWGIVSNEKKGKNWSKEAKVILQKYKDMVAVVVDIHI